MRIKREFQTAGKNGQIEMEELHDWEKATAIEKFNYPIYFHLLNNGIDPVNFSFERKFQFAYKRSGHEFDI